MTPSERRSAIGREFEALEIDCLLVSALPNIRYLSGFTGSNGLLVLDPSGKDVLLTDPRYTLRAAEEADCSVKVVSGSLWAEAAKIAKRKRWLHIGIESTRTTVASANHLQEQLPLSAAMQATAGVVERHRMRKSPQEIEAIRASARLNSKAFSRVISKVKSGLRENSLAAEIEYQMRRLGAEKPSFETIVAAGPRSALPHAQPSEEALENDQLLLIDMGAVLEGYSSDMTRMVHLGKAGKKVQNLYYAVLEAQLTAIEFVRAGVRASQVDATARKVLRRYGYDKLFVHSLGHGVGLEIHEGPRIGRRDESVLEPGMVITIEPGAYIQGFGGVRIEDMVLVTASGCENLTPTPKELLIA